MNERAVQWSLDIRCDSCRSDCVSNETDRRVLNGLIIGPNGYAQIKTKRSVLLGRLAVEVVEAARHGQEIVRARSS